MKPINPTVKRYRYPNGSFYWLVSCTIPPEGERYRKKHNDELSANEDRTRLIGLHTTSITQEEFEQAKAAILTLKNSPNPDVKGRSILDAAHFFSKRFSDPTKVLSLETYINEFLTKKRAENLRQPTLNELEKFLADFLQDFPTLNVTEFTPEIAEIYLTKTRPENRNRKAVLNQFFNYLAQTAQTTNRRDRVITSNPIRLITRKRKDERDITAVKILDVNETVAVLKRAASLNAQRLFAWMLFTGMRPTETVKFWQPPSPNPHAQKNRPLAGWDAINLRTGVIHVSPLISKTRTNRKIRIQPNFKTWLEHYKGQSFLTKNWRDKYGWSKDVLPESKREISDICRHTFISYLAHVAKNWQDIEIQAGNTKEIQMRHYLELVHDDPADFWKITPATVGVFDKTEADYAKQGYQNRKRAILENRSKIRRKRNGTPILATLK